MEKIDLAKNKESSLLNTKDCFFISIGLDNNNSGYLCYWDQENKQQNNLVLFGLAFVIGYCVVTRTRKDDRLVFFKALVENENKVNFHTPNIEELKLLFKNKFCLCFFIQENCSIETMSSGNICGNEILALLTYSLHSLVSQFSPEERADFLKKMLSILKEAFIDNEDFTEIS